jgi:hypothetical protein
VELTFIFFGTEQTVLRGDAQESDSGVLKHVVVTSNRWVSENTCGTADAQISLIFFSVMVPVLASKANEKLASIQSGFKLAWICTPAPG